MHEAQAKDSNQQTTTTAKKKAVSKRRAQRFYVLVKHRQNDPLTGRPHEDETHAFESKAQLRAALETPAYETAEIRVIRGYELTVRAKRNISVN